MQKNHPLMEAARYNDAQAEETGLLNTISSNGLNPEDVVYIAHQRALRLVILKNYGEDTLLAIAKNTKPQTLNLTKRDEEMVDEFSLAFLDGIMIGWKGNILNQRNNN